MHHPIPPPTPFIGGIFFQLIIYLSLTFYSGNIAALTAPLSSKECTPTAEYWRNNLASSLNLTNDQLKLYQGVTPTPSTSQEMWNIFNAIPPNLPGPYYDPIQVNLFSQNYGLILVSMTETSNTHFQQCMKNDYTLWLAYLSKNIPAELNISSISTLFEQWAGAKSPQSSHCLPDLLDSFDTPLNDAIVAFSKANGQYAWDKTLEDFNHTLASSPPKNINNNLTQECSLNIDQEGNNKKHEIPIKYDVTLSASFDNISVFYSLPYTNKSLNDPILQHYEPWFSPAVFEGSYNSRSTSEWDNNTAITWDKVFGDNGFMRNISVGIVSVKGMTLTITYDFRYSSSPDNINSINYELLNQIASSSCIPAVTPEDLKEKPLPSLSCTSVTNYESPVILAIVIFKIQEFLRNRLTPTLQ